MNLAEDMGVKQLKCLTDSQLTVGHINGAFQVKDSLLTKYYQKVSTLLSEFQNAKVKHVPRCKNAWADALSKLVLGKGKGKFDTVIHLTLSGPTVLENECMNIEVIEDWLTPIIQALKNLTMGKAILDKVLAKKAARYVFIAEDLYKSNSNM